MPPQAVQQPVAQEQPKSIFNIPQIPASTIPPGKTTGENPSEEPEPEKKSGWKKWLMTIMILIIVIGLGYYFLKP